MKNPQPQEWLAEKYSKDKVADYKPFNFVDGEGVRCSIYLSGCLFACEGCYNKIVQNFDYGIAYTDELEEQIMADLRQPYVQGLTLLGGEPFLNTKVALRLARRIRAEFGRTKDIWGWTGYYWDELASESEGEFLGARDLWHLEHPSLYDHPAAFRIAEHRPKVLHRGSCGWSESA